MMNISIRSLQIYSLLFLSFLLPLKQVEAKPARAPAAKVEQTTIEVTKDLSHVVDVPSLPEKPQFKGNFRKYLKMELDAEGKKIRMMPFALGNATLQVVDAKGVVKAEYLIHVQQTNLPRIAREVAALLGEIEGIQVKIINNKVIVDGEVLLPKDINRIHSVVSQYGELASNIVRLSPIAQKKIAEFIERDINNPEIHVRAINESFIIEGVANDEEEKKRAEIIAKTYVPDIVAKSAPGVKKINRAPVVNLLTLRAAPPPEPSKIIQIVVHYVEMKKDYQKGFRFQWTPEVSDSSGVDFSAGSRAPSGLIGSITGTISNLLPKLNWAKQHGHARVLQSSSVIVQSGERGQIRSVARIPYQIVGPQGQPSTSFEESGIITDVTPSLVSSSSDSIQLKVDFKLKSLLGLSDKGPLISSNDIQTVVTVRSGMSAAIGGLVSASSGTNYNKLPQNAPTNPLLSLYASKSFQRDRSQFVVFLTPIIKSSASAGTEQVKKKFRLRD